LLRKDTKASSRKRPKNRPKKETSTSKKCGRKSSKESRKRRTRARACFLPRKLKAAKKTNKFLLGCARPLLQISKVKASRRGLIARTSPPQMTPMESHQFKKPKIRKSRSHIREYIPMMGRWASSPKRSNA